MAIESGNSRGGGRGGGGATHSQRASSERGLGTLRSLLEQELLRARLVGRPFCWSLSLLLQSLDRRTWRRRRLLGPDELECQSEGVSDPERWFDFILRLMPKTRKPSEADGSSLEHMTAGKGAGNKVQPDPKCRNDGPSSSWRCVAPCVAAHVAWSNRTSGRGGLRANSF